MSSLGKVIKASPLHWPLKLYKMTTASGCSCTKTKTQTRFQIIKWRWGGLCAGGDRLSRPVWVEKENRRRQSWEKKKTVTLKLIKAGSDHTGLESLLICMHEMIYRKGQKQHPRSPNERAWKKQKKVSACSHLPLQKQAGESTPVPKMILFTALKMLPLSEEKNGNSFTFVQLFIT